MANAEWLELSEAAHLLGVHQSTLRRWADAGKVAFIRTLSGHRRFERASIELARQEMVKSPAHRASEKMESKSLILARQHSSDLSTYKGGWFRKLSEEQILLFRYSGQRLLGLMMQYISRSEGAETFLDEARNVASDYGMICFNAGLSVSETAEAFLHFRRSILESVIATSGLSGPNDQDGHRIFLKTSDFYDALLVATIDNYAKLAKAK
jgi:excisionase family DNA binding protein